MAEENKNQVVSLNSKESKAYSLIRKYSADSYLKQPTLGDIREISGARTNKEASALISSLTRKGIPIFRKVNDSEGKRMTHYSLSPECLDLEIKKDEKGKKFEDEYRYSHLYIGEPGFATKCFDRENTMNGLALFLEENGLTPSIREVDIQGSILPHIPPYASKSYLDDLMILDIPPRKEEGFTKQEEDLMSFMPGYEKKWYEKYLINNEKKKITDRVGASEEIENQLKRLMRVLPEETKLRLHLGVGDRKNIEHIKTRIISEYAKVKAEEIKEKKKEIENKLKTNTADYFTSTLQKICLEKILDDSELTLHNKERRNEYLERMGEYFAGIITNIREDFIGGLKNSSSPLPVRGVPAKGKVKDIIKFAYYVDTNIEGKKNKTKKFYEKISKIDEKISKIVSEKESLEQQLEGTSYERDWEEDLHKSGRSSITTFTKQHPVDSLHAEMADKRAKDEYLKPFFGFERIAQKISVHDSIRKSISFETKVITDVKKGEKEKLEADYEIIDEGKKKVLFIRNIREHRSDNITPRAIKDAKIEMNRLNITLNKIKETEKIEQPDLILLGAQMGGGFRVMPWLKESQNFLKDKFREEKDVGLLVNLPTLQSSEKLEFLLRKGCRNWNVKRYADYPTGNAAVLHREDKEGVNSFLVMDTDLLSEFGIKAAEIRRYREELKNNKKLPKDKKEELKKLIKQKRQEVKFNPKVIEAAGDFHLGAPDMPERYSKDQLIEAMKSYSRRHGLPDIVSWDEVLHGTMDRVFSSASRYMAKSPPEIKSKIINPLLKKPEEKMTPKQEAKFWKERNEEMAKELLTNHRAITIHNQAEQLEYFDRILKPYAEEILENGGKVILTSGNHWNKSCRNGDEAKQLAQHFPTNLRDEGRVIANSGYGNDFGMGHTVIGKDQNGNDQLLYVSHRFKRAQDEVFGIMAHLRKQNDDSAIIIGGDTHVGGVGYGDKRGVVLHQGMEPFNQYCGTIGAPGSARGFARIGYDPEKRGLLKMSLILTNTLEKIIEEENII